VSDKRSSRKPERTIVATGRIFIQMGEYLGCGRPFGLGRKGACSRLSTARIKMQVLEIDENLNRLDLTVWEQAKHAEERERVLAALGQRAKVGGQSGNKNAAKTNRQRLPIRSKPPQKSQKRRGCPNEPGKTAPR
jgi:hypothetical protein